MTSRNVDTELSALSSFRTAAKALGGTASITTSKTWFGSKDGARLTKDWAKSLACAL